MSPMYFAFGSLAVKRKIRALRPGRVRSSGAVPAAQTNARQTGTPHHRRGPLAVDALTRLAELGGNPRGECEKPERAMPRMAHSRFTPVLRWWLATNCKRFTRFSSAERRSRLQRRSGSSVLCVQHQG